MLPRNDLTIVSQQDLLTFAFTLHPCFFALIGAKLPQFLDEQAELPISIFVHSVIVQDSEVFARGELRG